MKARDIMVTDLVAVSPDHSVRHAARLMWDHRVSGLPVVDDDEDLVGIITEGDLMRRSELGPGELRTTIRKDQIEEDHSLSYVKSHSWKVADVMTRKLVTADEETPVNRIAALMRQHGVKRIPIMKVGHLVGLVSRADLLRAISEAPLEETASGDEAIRLIVLVRLRDDALIDTSGLTATVSNGVVQLSGTVQTEHQREAIRVVTEGVRGVRGILDNLVVTKIPS
jgi:CBS domain-containing protein